MEDKCWPANPVRQPGKLMFSCALDVCRKGKYLSTHAIFEILVGGRSDLLEMVGSRRLGHRLEVCLMSSFVNGSREDVMG